MKNNNLDFEVQRLGECRVSSPMSGVHFLGDDDHVLHQSDPRKIETYFNAGQIKGRLLFDEIY